jgi:transcription antitermination factor NusG
MEINNNQTMSKWSAEGYNWFVLFVRTGLEFEISRRLKQMLDAEKYHAFVPTRAYTEKKEGQKAIIRTIWLRSYVFVATTESADECIKMVEPLILNDSTIFKFVSYSDSVDTIFLSAKDMVLFKALLDDDFCLPAIKTKLENGKFKAIENQFKNADVKFGKYNPNKQTIKVQVEVLGEKMWLEVAYDETADFVSMM